MSKLKIEDLEVYRLSMELGEKIWNVVLHWDFFARDTLGKQIIRSSDSVALNISEGYGRYHYKENIHFCMYSRGSLFETQTGLQKARNRNLISTESYHECLELSLLLGKKLNNYINSIGPKTSG